MSAPGLPEIMILAVTVVLPIMAAVLVIYLVVRLAVRHEHRNRPER